MPFQKCVCVCFLSQKYFFFQRNTVSLCHIILTKNFEIMKTSKRFVLLLTLFLIPFVNVSVDVFASQIKLHVRIVDPTENQPADPKSPVLYPEVSNEDHVLTFDDFCLGCELRLMDEEGVLVYSATITSGTLVLPFYLSGNYELQIIRGNFCFYGDVSF